MCGIAGILRRSNLHQIGPELRDMSKLLAHRGPDGEGFFLDETAGLGFMHRRLAIIDLEGGRQPLTSDNGALVLVANGEIYNYRELKQRPECADYPFRTASDCEVILPLFRHHGTDAFALLDGMFALAIWDTRLQQLTLARDHVGIKPLHLWLSKNGLAFASEMKALYALREFQPKLSRRDLWDFFNLRYLPGDSTLLEGVMRLPPASWLQARLGHDGVTLKRGRYWAPPLPHDLNRGASVGDVRRRLEEAVASQLVADVNVGTYLSGGLDSSLVSSLASRSLAGLQSFTLGFGEPSDENADAQRVADALGTTHTSMVVRENLLASLEAAVLAVEEPKINHLQGFILAREASRHVKVALSGLGGDELFAGYARHEIAWSLRRWSGLMRNSGEGLMARLGEVLGQFPRRRGQPRTRQLLFAAALGSPPNADALLRNVFDCAPLALDAPFSHDFLREAATWPTLAQRAQANFRAAAEVGGGKDWLAGAMHHEFLTKLPNDYLLNEDRVSMAHGLEVRVPLLSVKLIELTRKLALGEHFESARAQRGQGTQLVGVRGKAFMRRAVAGMVPDFVAMKPKWGFQVSAWQQAEAHLLPLARELVTPEWLREIGLFDPAWVQRVLAAPVSARMNWHYYTLWMLTGLRLWWKAFLEGGVVQGLR